MTSIEIHTLWGLRKGFSEAYAELMVAWDENSIEANPEGWDAECAKAVESWQDDLMASRTITIVVPAEQIEKAFRSKRVTGSVAFG